jgi:ABC-2 type transport system permease protein
MLAIYKREMQSYFTSPVGYVFIAVFIFFNAGAFSLGTLMMGTNSNVGSYFNYILFLQFILIPILTMKMFSEDRRSRTEQLILTSPVSLMGMVFGKFLAAFTLFGGTLIIDNLLNFSLLYKYGNPNTASLISQMVGLLLVGAAFIAIGLFISALTENQIVAAFGTVGVIVISLIIGIFNSFIPSYAVRSILSWISVVNRYYNFTYGILDLASLLYYFSICFVFMFLTVRIYEKRRWA